MIPHLYQEKNMSLDKDEDLFSDLTTVNRNSEQLTGGRGTNSGEDEERGFPGVDEGMVSRAVEEVVRRVVKDSLAPMIQRVMLKIDSLDSKVKQMHLVHEDVCRETGEVKKQVEELKELVESIKGEMVERFDVLNSASQIQEEKKETESSVDVGALEDMFEKKASVVVPHTGAPVSSPTSSMNSIPLVRPAPPPPPRDAGSVSAMPLHHQGQPPAPYHHGPPPPPAPVPHHPHHAAMPHYAGGGGAPHRPPPPQDQYYSGGNAYQTFAPPASSTGYDGTMPGPPPPMHGVPGRSQTNAATKPTSVPIEKVIDDISIMGFSREEVRNVLRELTAQGKPVDMNIVLDRLGAR